MLKKIAIATALFLSSLLSSAHAQSFNVSLDGFCNTFALTIDAWSIYGARGGCGYTVIDGGAVAHVGTLTYRLVADTNDGSILYSWYFTKPRKKHGVTSGSWYLYGSNGTSNSLINSGTYTQMLAAGPEWNTNEEKDVTALIPKKQ